MYKNIINFIIIHLNFQLIIYDPLKKFQITEVIFLFFKYFFYKIYFK
jgi:hypothetical protein